MKTKTINIYGDITSMPFFDGDVSSAMIAKELGEEYDEIIVNINSYGGEVAEGLSIYNQLKNSKAKVKTICNGFACSIASIIFLAGDERVMCENSLMMLHNAWSNASGNSKELRKTADDLEKITQQSIDIYQTVSGLDEEKIKEMLDEETWLDAKEAMELGFITSIQSENKNDKASQSIKKSLIKLIIESKCKKDDKNKKCEYDDEEDDRDDRDDDYEDKKDKDKKCEEHTKCSYFYALKQKLNRKGGQQ